MGAEERSNETARLLALVVLWGAAFQGLSRFGVYLLPRALLAELSLQAYLALVQIATLTLGIAAARGLLGAPARTLGALSPTAVALATTLGLAPAVFAASTTTAFLVARPTLLAELAAGGRELAQRSTGEFGRELVQAPAILTVFWGAVLSPISEEAFFRGALWSLLARTASRLPGPRGLREGLVTLLVAAVFGLLHKDMPGGLGIVRFVSALGLGLACGLARQLSGSVVAACAVHLIFNALSIATVRRWVVTAAFPMKWGAPTLISALAVPGALAAIALVTAARAGRK